MVDDITRLYTELAQSYMVQARTTDLGAVRFVVAKGVIFRKDRKKTTKAFRLLLKSVISRLQ